MPGHCCLYAQKKQSTFGCAWPGGLAGRLWQLSAAGPENVYFGGRGVAALARASEREGGVGGEKRSSFSELARRPAQLPSLEGGRRVMASLYTPIAIVHRLRRRPRNFGGRRGTRQKPEAT
jgi:hypothetical protein